ncbi:MAG TPA: hypothetical protein VF719_08160 [Abditibacteriaceae bacterium]|jgi:hypothetical protein
MKFICPIVVFVLLGFAVALNPVFAAPKVATGHVTPTTAAAQYAQINREIGRCKIVERTITGLSVEGGTLRAYLLNGAPRKLLVHHYGESGKAVEEYYFWNGRLFFVLRAVFAYDEPLGSGQPGKPSGIKERRTGEIRLYFREGKLVRWQKGRDVLSPSLQEARDYAETAQLVAREMLEKLRS